MRNRSSARCTLRIRAQPATARPVIAGIPRPKRTLPTNPRQRSSRGDFGAGGHLCRRSRRTVPMEPTPHRHRLRCRRDDHCHQHRGRHHAALASRQHSTRHQLRDCRRGRPTSDTSTTLNRARHQSAARTWSPASSSATRRQPRISANCSRPSSGPLAITSSPGLRRSYPRGRCR